MMRTHLQNGWINFARLGSVSYVNTILNGEQIWKGHMDAGKEHTIRQNFRCLAHDFKNDRDQYFCRRDDWGNGPSAANPAHGANGIKIGYYRHDDPAMVNNNQHVWTLHLEMTSVERPVQLKSPSRPTGFGQYSAYA